VPVGSGQAQRYRGFYRERAPKASSVEETPYGIHVHVAAVVHLNRARTNGAANRIEALQFCGDKEACECESGGR
jgi:hypothetical protein